MNTNIMEALAIVLSELQRSRFSLEELSQVSELLRRQGFSPQEVAAALDLLQRRIDFSLRAGGAAAESSTGSWRVLTRTERDLFSPEAEGLLLEAMRNQLLLPLDLDRVMMLILREENVPVSKEILTEIITEVLMEKPPDGGAH